MMAKYELFTGPLPKNIYRSICDHLPSSPIIYWDIASQIRYTLANPKATNKATWKFSKEFDPITDQRVYGELSGREWWEEADTHVPDIQQYRHYLCPVSIFIDGPNWTTLGEYVLNL
jgi:hypothetical protein